VREAWQKQEGNGMTQLQYQSHYEQMIQDGLNSYARGDHAHAITTLGHAIALDPQDPNGFTQRGAIWAEYGDYVQAERDLRTALSIRTCAEASYHLALILSDQRRHSEAIALIEQAIAIYSADSELWHLFGIVLDRANESTRAIEALTHAISLGQSHDGELLALRGMIQSELEQWQPAAMDFELAIAYGNRGSDVFYHQGLTYLHLQRWAASATSFTRALRDDPHNPAIYQARSIAYEALGEKEYARQDMRMALRLGLKPLEDIDEPKP
jgi:Flp pilus assembly protein TadD